MKIGSPLVTFFLPHGFDFRWMTLALVAGALLAPRASQGQVPAPAGYWSFDGASLLSTTSGGGTMNGAGTYSAVTGGPAGTVDKAVRIASGSGNNLRCLHNIGANGGGSYVNRFTMMWDIRYQNSGTWKCLLQTHASNGNDGDLFINTNGTVGSSSILGGYGGSTSTNTWYRIVLVINTSSGTGNFDGKLYVNGSRVRTISNLNVDSTITLYPSGQGSFGIHHDNNNEDDQFDLSAFACWGTDLSDSQVSSLGGPSTALVKNPQTVTFAPLSNRTYGDPDFSLSATASSTLGVTYSVVSGPATVNGNTVTVTGVGTVTIRASQSGDANWAAASSDQTFTVAPKALTVSGAAVASKVYDGTNAATITGSLSGIVGSESVTFNGTGTFDTSAAGSGKSVTSTSTLSGAQADNYTLTQPTGLTASITPKVLTFADATAVSKVYDGTAAATITGTLEGVIGGDDVTFNGMGTFDTKDAGIGKSVTSTATLGGAQAGNYTLTPLTGLTGTIAPRALTVTADARAKAYGDPDPALTYASSGLVSGEAFAGELSRETGESLGNYSITLGTLSAGANYTIAFTGNVFAIAAKSLTLSGAAVVTKLYSGTTEATITGTLTGVVPGEDVTFTGVGSFASAEPGTEIPVTPAIVLGGADAANYSLIQPEGLTGIILSGDISFESTVLNAGQPDSSVALTLVRAPGLPAASATLRTDDGTASSVPPFAAAVAGTDYTDLEGSGTEVVSFGDGEASKTVTIALQPKAGSTVPNRRFTATIASVSAGKVGPASTATINILSADAVKPTVTITAPAAAGAAISDASPYTLRGTAGDAKGIARVTVALNGDAAVDATLGSATVPTSVPWSLSVTPSAGNNTIEVTAYDLKGNSATLSRSFSFSERFTLTLARMAPEAVALDTAGTVLLTATPSGTATALTPTTANANPYTSNIAPGSTVTLTATAKTGYAFASWTGLPEGATVLGNVATFAMPSGDISVTANFHGGEVFTGPAGSSNLFLGILQDPAGGLPASNATVGFLRGTMTATGAFSGTLSVDGLNQAIAATFFGDGSSVFTVAGVRRDSFQFGNRTLTLHYNADTFEYNRIHAVLTDGTTTITGSIRRASYSATHQVPSEWLNAASKSGGPINTGIYNVAFPSATQDPALDPSTYPQGEGYATVTLTSDGLVTGTGFLADGTAVTFSSALSLNEVSGSGCQIFAQLNTPGQAATVRGGSFFGNLIFDPTQADTDVAGTDLIWIRPDVSALTPGTTTAAIAAANLYTAGWPSGILVEAIGALYDKTKSLQEGIDRDGPSTDVNGTPLGYEDGKLVLTGGKLASSITKDNLIVSGSKVTKIPSADSSFLLTPAVATGTFTGSFRPNWSPLAKTNPDLKGILLQKGAHKGGHGFFLSNAQGDADPEAGDVNFTLEPLAGAVAPVTASIPATVSSTAPYTLSGTAGNDRGVARVEVVLNGGESANAVLGTPDASGLVRYSLPVAPVLGANTAVITIVDLRGNRSSTTVNFTFNQRFVLTVNRSVPDGLSPDAVGTVTFAAAPSAQATPLSPLTGNANPRTSNVQHGTSVNLTATPKAGYAFVRWTGLPSGSTAIGNVANFSMPQANTTVTAEFVSSSSVFAGAAGSNTSFYGLIRPEDGTATSNATVGFLSGNLNATTGLFSGALLVDGLRQTVNATFLGDGSAFFGSGATAQPSLSLPGGKTLSLVLNTGAGNDEIRITLTAASATSTGVAKRSPYSASNAVPGNLLNASATTGLANVVFPSKAQTPALDPSSYPQGDGFASLTITSAGTVTLSGTLADNSTFSATSGLVEGNEVPFLAQIVTPGTTATKGGSFSGTLKLDTTQADADVTGADLQWIRPAVTEQSGTTATAIATQLYTAGWPSGIAVNAVGALYNKAVTAQASLGLGAPDPANGNGRLEFADGKLTNPITKTSFNINGNTVGKIPASNASFTLTVTQATGAFSGTIQPDWTPAAKALPAYKGIILQKGANRGGFGFFLSNRPGDLDPVSGGVSLSKPQ